MKKHHLLIETLIFFLIFSTRILSAFLALYSSKDGSAPANLFVEWNFPWYHLISALFCLLLLFIYYEKTPVCGLIVYPVLITYGMLFATSLFIKAFSLWIGSGETQIAVTKPADFLQWFFCVLTFLFGAFNEEVIYRFYLSDKLYQLLSIKFHRKFIRWICEILALICFAIAHIYLGWLAVLNAALAHIFLRRCYLKSGRLWQPVLAHCIYNIVSIIIL